MESGAPAPCNVAAFEANYLKDIPNPKKKKKRDPKPPIIIVPKDAVYEDRAVNHRDYSTWKWQTFSDDHVFADDKVAGHQGLIKMALYNHGEESDFEWMPKLEGTAPPTAPLPDGIEGEDFCYTSTGIKVVFKTIDVLPTEIRTNLKEAMDLEQMERSSFRPDGPRNLYSLGWLIANESTGQVDVRNTQGSSARGLFQLTKVNWSLNPNGEASFGNAVEEIQGGIRYVRQRYKTPENAVKFWKKHCYY